MVWNSALSTGIFAALFVGLMWYSCRVIRTQNDESVLEHLLQKEAACQANNEEPGRTEALDVSSCIDLILFLSFSLLHAYQLPLVSPRFYEAGYTVSNRFASLCIPAFFSFPANTILYSELN